MPTRVGTATYAAAYSVHARLITTATFSVLARVAADVYSHGRIRGHRPLVLDPGRRLGPLERAGAVLVLVRGYRLLVPLGSGAADLPIRPRPRSLPPLIICLLI